MNVAADEEFFMEIISLFFKSFLIGVITATPIGPIGAFCLRKSINHSRATGLMAGLGVAVGGAFCVFMSTYALHGLTHLFLEIEDNFLFRLCAGLILLYLGLKHYMKEQNQNPEVDKFSSHHSVFFTTLVFTVSNPVSYVLYSSIYAGIGLFSYKPSIFLSLSAAGGIFLGECVLWGLIAMLVSKLQRAGSKQILSFFNHATSAVIAGFGIFILANCFIHF